MRGKHNKLGEGERKVRLGQDSLPNIAISVAETSGNERKRAETSGNYIRCFTRTLVLLKHFAKAKHGSLSRKIAKLGP